MLRLYSPSLPNSRFFDRLPRDSGRGLAGAWENLSYVYPVRIRSVSLGLANMKFSPTYTLERSAEVRSQSIEAAVTCSKGAEAVD